MISMIWLFLYKIYRILTGDRPIYNIIKVGDAKNVGFEVLYENIKFKVLPIDGEILYFKEGGPYYKVVRVAHHIDKFHTVWISVELINLEKK